ncbi:TolC family protein [Geothrix sp.]|uniref:TolC family protein n=1 Tax=Geothrix sp. TaxID=1962974 RepID=UPI0025C1ABBC|nr:TolC family protein [Geothrix sp.]
MSRALARPEWQAITQLSSRQGEGAAMEARTWLAPGLGWDRQRFTGPLPNRREDTILLTQSMDVSGRWMAKREAALKREEAGKAESGVRTAGVVAQVRGAFFEVVAARERVSRLDRALTRLGKVQEQVDRLHTAGEMSGLDRSRVRREMEIFKSRQAQEQAALGRAEAQLAVMLGEKAAELQGTLLPVAPEPLEQLLDRQQAGPGATMTRATEAAAQADAKAARRWMPDLQVGVGVKRWQENGLSGNGSVLSLGIALPIPSRVKGNQMKAEAEARAAAAQAKLQREQETSDLRSAWQEATLLRASAEHMSQEALQDPAKVETALEAAFRAGEMDLLARLDGARSLLEAELAALDQAQRARRACIALDRLLGKVNP